MKLSTYSYRFSAPHPPPADPTLLPEHAENSDTGEMDEPHFFPMIAQQYLSPGPSTDDEIDDSDSGIGALADNTVSPQRIRRKTGNNLRKPGIEEPDMYEDNLGIGGGEGPPAGEKDQLAFSRRWKGQQYPLMEPESKIIKPEQPEAKEPKTPTKRPGDGALPTTPKRKVTKPRKPKRLSVIHEVVVPEEEGVSERKPRPRVYKGLVKRIPGLSKYEVLRLRAEKKVPKWAHASPQREKKTVA